MSRTKSSDERFGMASTVIGALAPTARDGRGACEGGGLFR
jgi:hypothetical protein